MQEKIKKNLLWIIIIPLILMITGVIMFQKHKKTEVEKECNLSCGQYWGSTVKEYCFIDPECYWATPACYQTTEKCTSRCINAYK